MGNCIFHVKGEWSSRLQRLQSIVCGKRYEEGNLKSDKERFGYMIGWLRSLIPGYSNAYLRSVQL